jgi:integrase
MSRSLCGPSADGSAAHHCSTRLPSYAAFCASWLLPARPRPVSTARSIRLGFIAVSSCPALSLGTASALSFVPSNARVASACATTPCFLLMATYGLRSSEVVALRLDDIEWRSERIRVPQRKTGGSFFLPLTDEVGAALLDYLRRGRPALTCRELFLRGRAPAGVLKATAVLEAFQKWSRRSGLHIPFQGAHCRRRTLPAGARGRALSPPPREAARRAQRGPPSRRRDRAWARLLCGR